MTALRVALIALALALGGALGWMTDWGRDLFVSPEIASRKLQGKADGSAVLPDFKLGSDASAYASIAERPLLNPTRRPAPTQAVVVAVAPEPPRPQIRRGLYQLVGVSDFGAGKVAQVRELAQNRVRTVKVGDKLQELTVKKISNDSVELVFQGETDVLDLPKFTASGRVPQPPPPPAPAPLQAASPSQPIAGQVGQPVIPPQIAQVPPPPAPVGDAARGVPPAIQPQQNAAASSEPAPPLPLLPNGLPQTRENEDAFIAARRRARFGQQQQ